MITIGRVCTKIAGRDAGKICVVIDTHDKGMVLVDGETRRRKCNIRHLIPRKETLDLKKGATHEDVITLLSKAGICDIEHKKEPVEMKEAKEIKPKQATRKKTAEKKTEK